MEFCKIHYKIEGLVDIWKHFCYVSQETKDKFERVANVDNDSMYTWIGKWAQEDFGIQAIKTVCELNSLKDKIYNTYECRYPEIFIPSAIDAQGWVRVWVTEHMNKEVVKASKNTGGNENASN